MSLDGVEKTREKGDFARKCGRIMSNRLYTVKSTAGEA